MARTEITPTQATDAGVSLAATTGQVDGYKFVCHGNELLVVANSGASSRNFIIETPGKHGGDLAIADRTIAIPAGQTRYVSDINPNLYARKEDPDRGMAYINFDATAPTELNVRVLRVPTE